ncbi:MAG: HAD-IB family hydrolase [bacterium]|nr:HAD-IB family hydrolase [bacterium]
MKDYAAFFDLDHTILSISSGHVSVRYFYENKHVNYFDLSKIIAIFILERLNLVKIDYLAKSWALWFRGKKEADMLPHFLAINAVLKENVREGAIKEINFHKENNAQIILLSASLNLVCDHLKDYIPLDDVLCTNFESENGLFTGKMLTRYCFEKEKLNRAAEYCRENNFSLENAYYYGDSFNDRFILEAVGHPRCVTPDKKLLKKAQENNWDICNW